MARKADAPTDDAQQPTTDSDPATDADADADAEAIAVAINIQTRAVYAFQGPNDTPYPVELPAVRGEDSLEVRGDIHKAHLAALGYHFLGAWYDSDEGRELRELVAQLRATDDDVVEVLRRRLRARGLLDE